MRASISHSSWPLTTIGAIAMALLCALPASAADYYAGKTIELTVGATAAGGATRDYAYLHNHTSGTRFDVVAGFKGTTEIALAMERGEVDGTCGWDWSSVKSQKADWVRDKKLNVLVQVALDPEPELTRNGVPSIWKFVPKDDDRRVAELVVSQQ